MKERRKFCTPLARCVEVVSASPFAGSPITPGGTASGGGGTNEGGEYYEGGDLSRRSSFWEDFDEDLLEDIEDINDRY